MATKRTAATAATAGPGMAYWRLAQAAENYWRMFFAGPLGIQAWNEGWSGDLRHFVRQAAMPAIRAGETPNVSIPTERIEAWRQWFVVAASHGRFAAGTMVDGNGNARPGCEQGVRPWPADYEDWHSRPDPRPPRPNINPARAAATIAGALTSLKAVKPKRQGSDLWPEEPSATTATSAFEDWRDDPKRQTGAMP